MGYDGFDFFGYFWGMGIGWYWLVVVVCSSCLVAMRHICMLFM